MSEFSKKLFAGRQTDSSDWQDHLIEAHQAAPGMTPSAFSPFKTREGKNSYERLADSLSCIDGASIVVLDLACGDGALASYCIARNPRIARIIGADMSQAELNLASRLHPENSFQWICSKAQNLPLAANSIDVVLCHMAFMLMHPIETVRSEIRRVLRKGGTFSAVTGNPDKTGGLYGRFQGRIRDFLKSEYPQMGVPHIGDSRASSIAGLEELFNQRTGFLGSPAIEDFDLEVILKPQDAWNFFKDFYLIGMLPAAAKERLKENLTGFAKEHIDRAGKVSFDFPMRKFSVVRDSLD